jgi:hypothetical protein
MSPLDEAEPGPSSMPPADMSARIRELVARDMAPQRGPSPLARIAAGSVAAAIAVGIGAMMGRDLARAPANVLAVVMATLAAIVVATGLGVARKRPAPLAARVTLALLPPLAFAAIVLVSGWASPSGMALGADALGACLTRGAMLAALPLVVAVVAWRRTDPFTPRLTGAMLGGWAGLAGAVGVTLGCPSSDVWHIAIAHGGAVVGGALIGAVVARRFLRP